MNIKRKAYTFNLLLQRNLCSEKEFWNLTEMISRLWRDVQRQKIVILLCNF
jgi:hypothetical protein